MTDREHFKEIIAHKASHSGYWHGHPNEVCADKIFSYFGVKDDFELGSKLGSIAHWVLPEEHNMWTNPDYPMFDFTGGNGRNALDAPGVFAETENVADVEKFHWPEMKYVDFSETVREIERAHQAGKAVLSGTWCVFFQNACMFFGIANYFIKMYTDPDVVEAVTRHMIDFYLEANEKLYSLAGDKIDAFFFGNDFGTQQDLFVSPELFDRFVMPYFREFTSQAHRHGYPVVLHSCGAIERVIPRLIDAGVEILHPIQAKARNMDAVTLSKKYNGKIIFMGGVDTQDLLPFGKPEAVKAEVRRLRDLFGPNFIVSPSHESILPDVPPENIAALSEAAHEA
jgi:uroporphyrinogen decarboxylase